MCSIRARDIRRSVAPFRRRLVAARRRLPGLSPQLRRLDRRWGGGPAGDHRAPRPPRPGAASASTRSGCRRSTRRRGSTSATTSAITTRRSALRNGGGFRPARREAHRRGIRVVLDLVMNHTSDAHPWFVASRADPHRTARRLVPVARPAGWRPGGAPLPPNNWVSFFGGPGWEWEPRASSSTTTRSCAEQPELNWRAPGVEAAQFAMVRGWLARGVDGFRLDVFNTFLKDTRTCDPTRPGRGRRPGTAQVHLYDRDQPDFPALIGRFRAILDEAPGRMSVGELFDGTVETAAELHDRPAPRVRLGPARRRLGGRRRSGRRSRSARPRSGTTRWPTAVLSNHDQPRHVTAVGGFHRRRGQRRHRARPRPSCS